MIRSRTGQDGDLDFYDDAAPATVVVSVTPDGVTGAAVAAADITDASTVGAAVLTAEDAAAARTALGVGTATLTAADAISPGTATDVQGILAELAARITALEP